MIEKILAAPFKGYLNRRFPDWRLYIDKLRVRAGIWLKGMASELLKIALLAVVVCLAYIGVLYFLRGSWYLFADTMIGGQYSASVGAERAAEISWILSFELKYLGLIVVMLALSVSIVVGVVGQLTMLIRYFYVGHSVLVKLIWMALVGAVVADQLIVYYPMGFYLSFGLGFLPTMIILSAVLASAGRLLPELNLLLFMKNYRAAREIQDLKNDLAELANREPGED